MTATCTECGRVFDLTDDTDAEEWGFGHDCPNDEPPIRHPGLLDREPWSGGFADNH